MRTAFWPFLTLFPYQRAPTLGETERFQVLLSQAPSSMSIEAPLIGLLPYIALPLAVNLYPLQYPLLNR